MLFPLWHETAGKLAGNNHKKEMHMKKEPLFIAFASQKGGVGKTAFTVLTAGILRYQRGYNVAVVDCDPPQHSIGLMRDRDLECVKENDSLKMALYRQYKQKPQKAYPIIKSEPENAVENFYRYMREQETEFDIVLFDLPRAFRYMGMIRTLALMHHIFIPLKADDAVMQSTLQFASVIREELVSHEDYPLKGIHLFWNMIDKREDKGTFEAWNKTICDSKLHLMTTCVPETKRYNREASSMQGGIFRSTLLLPDNQQVKGSGLMELVDEICGIIGLAEKQGESPMTNLM